MKIFKIKSRWTKWIPLGNFSYAGTDYITFAKKNKANGMLKFKTKKVNGFFGSMGHVHSILPVNLIDTKKAWGQLSTTKEVGLSKTNQ